MDKIRNYQIVRKNILKMLENRKFHVSPELYLDNYKDVFTLFKKNKLDISTDKYYIKFSISEKIKPSLIKHIIEDLKNEQKNKLILIIIEKKPNKSILKLIVHDNIQIFWYDELMIDKTKHVLVPKHILLSKNEGNEVLEMYKLQSRYQLPLILKNDPMAKYLNVKKGNILKIIRNSISSGTYISYRCVS